MQTTTQNVHIQDRAFKALNDNNNLSPSGERRINNGKIEKFLFLMKALIE